MTTGMIMQTLIYVISMEFLSLRDANVCPGETPPVARSEGKRLFSQAMILLECFVEAHGIELYVLSLI